MFKDAGKQKNPVFPVGQDPYNFFYETVCFHPDGRIRNLGISWVTDRDSINMGAKRHRKDLDGEKNVGLFFK